jgi:AbrB family looped-hinge helix DNA binding protein
MITAQVSDKGQITIPADVRRKLGLKAKSRVEIEIHGKEAVLRPMKSISELYGVFHDAAEGKTTDWDEIREEAYRIMAEEYGKKHAR